MAIIIEEEKKGSNILSVLAWVLIILIIACAIYYIFFVTPQTAVILPTSSVQNLAPLSQSGINAQAIVNGSAFQSLKSYVPLPTSTGPAAVGRTNPFVSP